MLDISYFKSNNSDVQIFQNAGSWQTWIKPRGAKAIYFTVIGAGAGGGGGLQAAGTRGGGAGGGSAAITTGTILADVVPDVLYIFSGRGGRGGIGGDSVTNTNGGDGECSYMCITPDTGSATGVIIKSGTTAATGGAKGTTASATGGSAETAFTVANGIFSILGGFDSFAGSNASAGNTTAGSNYTAGGFVTAGTGGGNTTGGGMVGLPITEGLAQTIAGVSANTNGREGIIVYRPVLFFVGGFGAGGGTTGGKGGNGAPGCGGGGGGAGSTSAGNGGNGGNGLVIIKTIF